MCVLAIRTCSECGVSFCIVRAQWAYTYIIPALLLLQIQLPLAYLVMMTTTKEPYTTLQHVNPIYLKSYLYIALFHFYILLLWFILSINSETTNCYKLYDMILYIIMYADIVQVTIVLYGIPLWPLFNNCVPIMIIIMVCNLQFCVLIAQCVYDLITWHVTNM